MPGNRFALAVRVGCEIDLGGAARFLADTGQDVAAPADCDVLQGEIIIHIHANLAFGQVADVPLSRFHLVTLPQKFTDGARLGRRFDDNEFLFGGRHKSLFLHHDGLV